MSSRFLGKFGAEIAVLSLKHFYCQGTKHCSIIRKMHFCACDKLCSRSLGKIGAEIAVLSWNNFYSQGTTVLFHYQETEPLRMLETEFFLLAG
jgi:hypothetical protein